MFGFFENKTRPQEIKKEAVLNAIRAYGTGDQRAKDLLLDWIIQQEAKADSDLSGAERVLIGTETAEIYLAAGDTNEAKSYLDYALDEARGQKNDELYVRVVNRIDEMGAMDLVFS